MTAYTLQAQEVRISNGAYVTVDGNAQIVMNGMGLNNNGNFRALSGTLVFTGGKSEGASFISGTSFPSFHHLRIDRTSGDLQLNTRIFVDGNLEFINGNVDLNNYSIDLGSTGKLVGESRNARLLGQNGGYVKSNVFIEQGQEINPGNLGLQLSSNQYLGNTTIIRGHLQQQNKNGEVSIERYYEVAPAFPIADKMKVRAYFLDVESTNFDPQQLGLWSSADAGRNWSQVKTDATNYELTKSDGPGVMRITYFNKRPNNQLNNTFIQLYPNPVRDRFTLAYYSAEEEDIIVNLYSKNGQLLEAKKIRALVGLNKIDWNVDKYSAGNYQLRIMNKTIRNLAFVKE
jgi:hypothetical protein